MLKLSQHRVDRSYEREAHQLDLLHNLGLPAPKVYACSTGTLDDPHSFLLMEFMPGVPLNEAKQRCTSEQFDDLQRHLAEMANGAGSEARQLAVRKEAWIGREPRNKAERKTRFRELNLFFGGVQAAERDPDGRFWGGGDPRRGGAAIVVAR